MKHQIRIVLLVLLFTSISASVYALPYTGSDITLLGTQYSATSGVDPENTPQSGERLWYTTDEGAIWTAWGGLWAEYEVNLATGNWNMGLNVTNHGNVGDGNWYSEFHIINDLTDEIISIPASDDETNFGFVNVDIIDSGLYTVRFTWQNDKYSPSQGLDANIQIDNVFFDNTATAPVPEPTTMLLLGTGLISFAGLRRRKQ